MLARRSTMRPGACPLLFLALLLVAEISSSYARTSYWNQQDMDDMREFSRPVQTPKCKRLLWITSLSLHWNPSRAPQTKDYIDYLEVAFMSALLNAPSLVPVLVYDGPPNMLTAWFENMGGLVVFHYLSVYKELREAEVARHISKGTADFTRGTYLRFDIPGMIPRILEKFGDEVEHEYYLYTDSDVMFLQDITSCSLPKPKIMMMGPEFEKGVIGNAGVLYINAAAMLGETPALLDFARGKGWKLEAADQTLLLEHMKDKMEVLPDTFNWKGYWGSGKNISVIHWHGPKPMRCLPCFLMYPEHYHKKCADACGGLVNVLATFVKDNGRYYKKLMQIWFRLRVEVKNAQRLRKSAVDANGDEEQ